MRVRVYARMYARAYDSGQIVIRTHDQDQDQDQDQDRTRNTAGTQDTTGTHHRKREDSGKQNLIVLGDLHAKNEKS